MVFRYPSAGQILCQLLSAIGYGDRHWPTSRISTATFKRIAGGTFRQYHSNDYKVFVAQATRLLLGGYTHGDVRSAQVNTQVEGVFLAYDRTRSVLNADVLPNGASSLHALPSLALTARVFGMMVGSALVLQGYQFNEGGLEAIKRLPMVEGSFSRTIRSYFESATPGMNWLDRAHQSGISRSTLERWRNPKTPPRRGFSFSKFKDVSAFLASKLDETPAERIEHHLRWVAGGERLRGLLVKWLGVDAEGRAWVDHLVEFMALYSAAPLRVYSDRELLMTELDVERWGALRSAMLEYWRNYILHTRECEEISDKELLEQLKRAQEVIHNSSEAATALMMQRALVGLSMIHSPFVFLELSRQLSEYSVSRLAIEKDSMKQFLSAQHWMTEELLTAGPKESCIFARQGAILANLGMPISRKMSSAMLSSSQLVKTDETVRDLVLRFRRMNAAFLAFDNATRGMTETLQPEPPISEQEQELWRRTRFNRFVSEPGSLDQKFKEAAELMKADAENFSARMLYVQVVYQMVLDWTWTAWQAELRSRVLKKYGYDAAGLQWCNGRLELVRETLTICRSLIADKAPVEAPWRAEHLILCGELRVTRLEYLLHNVPKFRAPLKVRECVHRRLKTLVVEMRRFCEQHRDRGDAMELLGLALIDLGVRKEARRWAKEARSMGFSMALEALDKTS